MKHYVTKEEFGRRSAKIIAEHVQQRISKYGVCVLGLSGGNTPRPVYEALANIKDIDWAKVQLFLIDERYTPKNEDYANRMLHETLIDRVPIPAANVHLPNTDLPLRICIDNYAAEIRTLAMNVDSDASINVLGIGPDGHTASLFPPYVESEEALEVVGTQTELFPVHQRVSLTLRSIQHAGQLVFLLPTEERLTHALEVHDGPVQQLMGPKTDVIAIEGSDAA